MNLSYNEFCSFSKKGQNRLVNDFGEILGKKSFGASSVDIIKIYGFHVIAHKETGSNDWHTFSLAKNLLHWELLLSISLN
jgi:hypothetical protein